MNGPKTMYLKKLIKEKNFDNSKDRAYVEDLMYIEHGILVRGALGWAGAMLYFQKKSKYPSEYKAMMMELDPKGYFDEIKRKKKNEEDSIKNNKIRDLEIEKSFQDFKAMWAKVKSEKN